MQTKKKKKAESAPDPDADYKKKKAESAPDPDADYTDEDDEDYGAGADTETSSAFDDEDPYEDEILNDSDETADDSEDDV